MVEAAVQSALRRQRPREVAYELEEEPQDQVWPADEVDSLEKDAEK